jgi:two-component system response regulator AtoC
VLADVRRMADSDANVLITGETGVGKNLVARLLHDLSVRRSQPFVEVDCPSLATMLVESELFGHQRGAFTDATAARVGRFEAAGEGTIYLDRVAELSLELQGKLLRLVDEKRGERLGGNESFDVRARIVASAGSDLLDAVSDGRFRDDLYHRLRVLPLHVPPLRERPTDILPLAQEFLKRHGRGPSGRAFRLTERAARSLRSYSWPGNVRELEHSLERAIVAASGSTIDVSDLPPEILLGDQRAGEPGRMTLAEIQRRHIDATLREAGGNQTRAAAMLGISRKALWEHRKRHGLS